jgi:hypothetical protein
MRSLIVYCIAISAGSALAQDYRIERIASGLAQPTYLAQAPGDPANIVYYATRITAPNGTGGGFGTLNNMGGIFRYDMNTRSSTQVMSLQHRQLIGDEGLAGFTFSPDFNTPGAPGYQKLYVSTSQFNNGASPIDRVEEYVASGPNGTVPVDGLGRPVVNRVVLEYLHVNNQQNHTVNWVGFDPRASSLPVGTPERNYLYIVTGDGALGANAQSRPEQKANDIRGKLLRVDVDAANGDAYPADANKNFAIPPTNPVPLWNSTHPANEQLVSTTLAYTNNPMTATYAPALPEVYATGLRNTYRMSFDRVTGDFWGGDVGELAREEINFLKADTYNGSQPPIDFGYAQREGTIATNGGLGVSGSTGATTLQWNLSGGGTHVINSTNPVREGQHAPTNTPDEIRTTERSAYIGGYVYRGPVESLQGNYFYSDFIHSNIFILEDFDRNIPLASYSGTNFNQVNGVAALGTRTTVASADANSLWQSLIVDPTDPNYTAALGPRFGIGRAVSFGEDNAGNLYIIDFGSNRGDPSFGGDYPAAGLGEIFRIVPNLEIIVTIDRDTGGIVFSNETGEITDIRGYTLLSGAGALEPNALTPITGRLDASPTGNGSIDPNNVWAISSESGDRHEFGEASTGGAASLSIDEQFVLSPDEGWIPSIYEDLQLSVVLGDGTEIPAVVEYIGNGGQPFDRSDLNFNGMLDPADWPIFRSNHLESFPSLTRAESYHQGDLDGDGDNDFTDFRLFQADYIAANGAAAFDALFNVPEPSAIELILSALGMAAAFSRRNRRALMGGTPRLRRAQSSRASGDGRGSAWRTTPRPSPQQDYAYAITKTWVAADRSEQPSYRPERARYDSPGRSPGYDVTVVAQALKGRHTCSDPDCALLELQSSVGTPTQGCALGYHILPFQGNERSESRCCTNLRQLSRCQRVYNLAHAQGRATRLYRAAAVVALTAATLMVLLSTPANAELRHRYSFSEGVAANATNRTIIDSVSGANGIVRGTGSSASAAQLILSGGSSTTGAYVDLPNGLVSSLTDVTFEAWYSLDGVQGQGWARIFDFGSTEGGELMGPGGGGQGLDNIFYAPMRGTNIDAQRAGMRNNDPLFGPGGSAGPVGVNEMLVDPEFNHSLDVQYHVALVYDADGGNDPGEASLTLYINGALPPGEAANPTQTMIQLENLNDVNNWLGRSNYTNDSNLDGMLNEFRIYDQVLSAEQISANTAAGPDVIPVLGIVSLEVNTVTGSVQIKNSVESPIPIDYYTITSTSGALDATGWLSLADQNLNPVGPGQGESWDEADQSDEFELAELYLLGSSGVTSTSPLQLGHAFDVSQFGPGMNGDLQFRYARPGSGLVSAAVAYVSPGPLAGDYNGNGTVDAADYVVWRDTLGSTTMLGADGDDDGDVDQHDYTVWRRTFGNAAAPAQSTTVPEPAGAGLLIAACMAYSGLRVTCFRRGGVSM